MAEPGNLVDLALHALGKYIYMLYSNQKSLREAEVTCNNIHDKIIKCIPPILADKVTNELLQYLDHLIYEGESCQSAAICELFIKSILHPAVTKIVPFQNFQDIEEVLFIRFCNSFCCADAVSKNIHMFHNLKIINMPGEYDETYVCPTKFPEQLIEFYGFANDILIAQLANQCKYLKVLNIYESRVTDTSIESMLQMRDLVKLNISETFITCRGITNLLTKIIENYGESCKLRYLITSAFSQEHLNIIAKKLPNLKVIVHKWCVNDIFSTNFQNVIGLDLTNIPISISEMKHLLEEIGKQLIYLSIIVDDLIEEIEISEMIPIGQNCTCLKSLSVSINACPFLIESVQNRLLGFQTISELQINFGWPAMAFDNAERFSKLVSVLKFLLFNCINVKKLALPICEGFYCKYELVKIIVEMGFIQGVQEIYFNIQDSFDYLEDDYEDLETENDSEVVKMLIGNCPNIRFISGVSGLKNYAYNTQRLKCSSGQ